MNLCQCGCGSEVSLSKKTSTRDGTVRGQPNRFYRGHRAILTRSLDISCACGAPLKATKLSKKYCDSCLRTRRLSVDKVRQKSRRLNAGHKAKYRAWFLKKTYGISIEQYEAMFANQGERCAICLGTEPRTTKSWHVDHDHVTGTVRGILCSPCNLLLGIARDRVVILEGAIRYLAGTNIEQRLTG